MDVQAIAVLGAGNIGGTLGRKWIAAGYPVVFGVQDPESPKAQALSASLGSGARLAPPEAALKQAQVVLFAIPGAAMEGFIRQQGAQLEGKIVLDAANRLGGGAMNSFAEFQAHAPGARFYRAFNSLGWENFENPRIGGVQADLFYCGPEGPERATVEKLIEAVGLRPVYLGGEDQVGLVDAVGGLWFNLALRQGKGRRLAFKVLSE